MKRKIISKILAVMLALCMSVSFVGCGQSESVSTGPIPNGRYELQNSKAPNYYLYVENESYDFYWVIEGEDAECWTSGSLDVRAKIVEREGKIYFECYKWDDPLFNLGQLLKGEKPKKIGSTNIYLVEYNAEEKSITVELYQKGER